MNSNGFPTGARTICLCHYNATNYMVQKTSLSLYMYYKKKTLSFIILFRLVKMQQDSLTIKHEVVVAMSLNAASAHHTLL